MRQLRTVLADIEIWSESGVDMALRDYAKIHHLKIGKIFQPLRAALTGSMNSPGVTEVAFAFGRDKTLKHIDAVI